MGPNFSQGNLRSGTTRGGPELPCLLRAADFGRVGEPHFGGGGGGGGAGAIDAVAAWTGSGDESASLEGGRIASSPAAKSCTMQLNSTSEMLSVDLTGMTGSWPCSVS